MDFFDTIGRTVSNFNNKIDDVLYLLPNIFDLDFSILKGLTFIIIFTCIFIILFHIALNFKLGAKSLALRILVGISLIFLIGKFSDDLFNGKRIQYIDMDLISTDITNDESLKKSVISDFKVFSGDKATGKTIKIRDQEFEYYLKPAFTLYSDVSSEDKCENKKETFHTDGAIYLDLCVKKNGNYYLQVSEDSFKSIVFSSLQQKIQALKDYYVSNDVSRISEKQKEIIDFFQKNYVGKLTSEEQDSLKNLNNTTDTELNTSYNNFIASLGNYEGTKKLEDLKKEQLNIYNRKNIDISPILDYIYNNSGNQVMIIGDRTFVFYTKLYDEAYDFDEKGIYPKYTKFSANNEDIEGRVILRASVYKLGLSSKNSYALSEDAIPKAYKNLELGFSSGIGFLGFYFFKLLFLINIILFLFGNLFFLYIILTLFPIKSELGDF